MLPAGYFDTELGRLEPAAAPELRSNGSENTCSFDWAPSLELG